MARDDGTTTDTMPVPTDLKARTAVRVIAGGLVALLGLSDLIAGSVDSSSLGIILGALEIVLGVGVAVGRRLAHTLVVTLLVITATLYVMAGNIGLTVFNGLLVIGLAYAYPSIQPRESPAPPNVSD